MFGNLTIIKPTKTNCRKLKEQHESERKRLAACLVECDREINKHDFKL